jgi:hypothetical protein
VSGSNLYASLSSLLAAAVAIAIGISVFLRDRSRDQFRLFAAFCLNLGLFHLARFFAGFPGLPHSIWVAQTVSLFLPYTADRCFSGFIPAAGAPPKNAVQAPLLALLEPAAAAGHQRIAVIGIPCQVHALRAIEAELGLERIYVIGTPCSDNTTTGMFHRFLDLLDPDPASITYLEFRADFHVELRHADGRVRTIPFLQLPISKLPDDFFPLTCRTCVDYTNVLADITVGYMGGTGAQWLLVRNARGEELLELIEPELHHAAPVSAGKRQGAVKGFLANTERAAGGLRRLVGLRLLERGVLRDGLPLFEEERTVGTITSGGFSPTLNQAIALARVAAPTGAACMVEIRGRRRPVQLVRPPFVRHGKPCLSD